MPNRKLITATRAETQYELAVLEGQLPTDWYGHVFINSPAGTVASGGLPYTKEMPEWGAPIMNGDGYVLRFDLDKVGKVSVQTVLMKPPCYYADEATKAGNAGGYSELEAFKSMGLTRMSMNLGVRNQLNTAITPFQFAGDAAPRLLASYDAGRPWEISATDGRMITAIGAHSEYAAATPPPLFPFPPIQTTAHPSFDPLTQELFLVNFTHPPELRDPFTQLAELMKQDLEKSESFLETVLERLNPEGLLKEAIHDVEGLFDLHTQPHERASLSWLHGLLQAHHTTTTQSAEEVAGGTSNAEVYLLRWTGSPGPLDRWQVVDEEGNPVAIKQCMHQTAITEDYVVLADASFKFSLDLMFNAPFKSARLNNTLRKLLTVPQLPYLNIYLIARKDLTAGGGTIVGRRIKTPIQQEAVHFSADYRNPGGRVTLHLAHNSAACLAEWVRSFDTRPPEGLPVSEDLIGMMTVCGMDLGRIGKVTLDATASDIYSQDYLHLPGNIANPAQIGAHTWGVGLNAYRGMIDAATPVDTIRYNYWSTYGLDPNLLTTFIYNLYFNYADRIIPDAEVLKLSEEGIPFVLSRQNTATMELEDFYQFAPEVHITSVQFIPRTGGAPAVTNDDQKDGYILVCASVNSPNTAGDNWQCQIWIFKAWDLASGPLCRLAHPDLSYAFSLHTAWIPELGARNSHYFIDPRTDYEPLIAALEPAIRRPGIQRLFEEVVYPQFPHPESGVPAGGKV